MSSFKRKGALKPQTTMPGTRPSPGSAATILTSTGIPSLDDILGGGVPLSCSLVVAAPDPHSLYGELVQKYFVAQGIVSAQNVLVIDDDPLEFVKGCMWTGSKSSNPSSGTADDEEARSDEKIKIAWRYENMKQFQTTVGQSIPNMEDFCSIFDLSSRIPETTIQRGLKTGQLNLHDVNSLQSPNDAIKRIEEVLISKGENTPLRVAIPCLGSPAGVKCLRSLPSHISSEGWAGKGWTQEVGWLSDAFVSLAAFTANPSMTALFPSHHGLVHIHTLPAPHTLLPPSDRFSTLRGLSAAATDSSGSGENNLAFKCTRKRLVFETLHLDLEGGVSERRTTPSATQDLMVIPKPHQEGHGAPKGGTATVKVELEAAVVPAEGGNASTTPLGAIESADVGAAEVVHSEISQVAQSDTKVKKPKKKVGFRSDRPDVYDF